MAEVRTVAKGRSKWGPGVTEETDGDDRWGSLLQYVKSLAVFTTSTSMDSETRTSQYRNILTTYR